VVTRDGQSVTSPPKFFAVLGAMVRDLDELPPPLVARMWRVAVRNEPIPQQAMVRALSRFRLAVMTDDPVRTAGVGLLKAFRRRQGDKEIQPMLNPDHPNAAYQCGRLLAALDYLQYRALGDVGAGVVQRYFGAASTTPALVLGRLLRLAQFHLSKLENKERRGFEHRISEVMNRLDEIPKTLSLEEQTLFALGYYQQKAYRPPAEAGDETQENETSEETK
jgi:CRISPR-associated protein Csd1